MEKGAGKRPWRISIRVTVVGMFLLATAVTAGTAIGLQYHFSAGLAAESALELYQSSASSMRDYLASADRQAEAQTRMLAAQSGLVEGGKPGKQARHILAEVLARDSTFYAAYLGFDDGRFYELINLEAGSIVRDRYRALPQDRWVVVAIDDGQRTTRYFDASFELRAERHEASDYRADTRPWFVAAEAGQIHKTEPYFFQLLQAPGQTYSTRIAGTDAVLGLDIAMASISRRMAEQKTHADSDLYLFQPNGELIASSENPPPASRVPAARPLSLTPAEKRLVAESDPLLVSNETDWPPFDFTVAGQPRGYAIDVLDLVSQMTGLTFRYLNGPTWPEFVEQFRIGRLDVLHPVLDTAANRAMGTLSAPMVEAPFGVLRRKSDPPVTRVQQLFGKRVAIPAGWSSIPIFRAQFPELEIVEVDGVDGMFEAVRSGAVDAGLDTAAPLRYNARQYFHDDVAVHAPLEFGAAEVPTALHYLLHPNRAGVIELVNRALAEITPAQKRALRAKWLLENGRSAPQATVPYQTLVQLADDPTAYDRLHRVSLDGERHFVYLQPLRGDNDREIFAVVTPVSAALAPALAKVKRSVLITGLLLLLLVPLVYWLARFIVTPIRQLSEENDKIIARHYDALSPVTSHIVEIDDLGGSMHRMAKAIERHLHEQEALMDAFVKVIADAIDHKSPYTGAHCRRVPELALMLAEKAQTSRQAPFDAFAFRDEHEWREFRIGAWLHDCGKITTPEHVVDKGVKLETIHNRIHEIRTRFEVLWRDAEIEALKARLADCRAGLDRESEHAETLERRQRQLQDDFAFIAACNDGEMVMDEAAIARLDALAGTTWQRHFDDHLGLSAPERARRDGESEPLPATETLLADKPWHRIPHRREVAFDPRLGIRMPVPECLYDLGELHNLKIERGTLSPEERFKIQEHVIGTIKILDRLPLPDELKRVPRYASTHHETLDGRGYPRRLTGAELSIPERIMVLADIFEALTASDRPYKPPKRISEAVEILYRMVEDEHIDRDVFELFLESGVYLDYARRYLDPSQIDAVDLSRYCR